MRREEKNIWREEKNIEREEKTTFFARMMNQSNVFSSSLKELLKFKIETRYNSNSRRVQKP